jgi:hypothetical protein
MLKHSSEKLNLLPKKRSEMNVKAAENQKNSSSNPYFPAESTF